KTLAEIDAIYEYKIHDPETFLNNRHSDYYAGRVTSDTLTFVKHSGLFAHAFTFAHVQTGEPKYLAWARKAADLFWGYRDPRTNLVRGCVQRKDEPVARLSWRSLFSFCCARTSGAPSRYFSTAPWPICALTSSTSRPMARAGTATKFRPTARTESRASSRSIGKDRCAWRNPRPWPIP